MKYYYIEGNIKNPKDSFLVRIPNEIQKRTQKMDLYKEKEDAEIVLQELKKQGGEFIIKYIGTSNEI